MRNFINYLLLIVMFFSIAHGVVLQEDLAEHCSVTEYVSEFSVPIDHHDEHDNELCESHFMLHLSFLLPKNFSLFDPSQGNLIPQSSYLVNLYTYNQNTFRPPIF